MESRTVDACAIAYDKTANPHRHRLGKLRHRERKIVLSLSLANRSQDKHHQLLVSHNEPRARIVTAPGRTDLRKPPQIQTIMNDAEVVAGVQLFKDGSAGVGNEDHRTRTRKAFEWSAPKGNGQKFEVRTPGFTLADVPYGR